MVGTPKAKFDPLTDVIFILYIHFQEMRLVKTKRKTKRADVSLQEILLLLTSHVYLSIRDDSHICATHFFMTFLADGTKLPAKKFDSLNRKLFYFCCVEFPHWAYTSSAAISHDLKKNWLYRYIL